MNRYRTEYDDVWDMWVVIDDTLPESEGRELAHVPSVDDAEMIAECLNAVEYERT